MERSKCKHTIPSQYTDCASSEVCCIQGINKLQKPIKPFRIKTVETTPGTCIINHETSGSSTSQYCPNTAEPGVVCTANGKQGTCTASCASQSPSEFVARSGCCDRFGAAVKCCVAGGAAVPDAALTSSSAAWRAGLCLSQSACSGRGSSVWRVSGSTSVGCIPGEDSCV